MGGKPVRDRALVSLMVVAAAQSLNNTFIQVSERSIGVTKESTPTHTQTLGDESRNEKRKKKGDLYFALQGEES